MSVLTDIKPRLNTWKPLATDQFAVRTHSPGIKPRAHSVHSQPSAGHMSRTPMSLGTLYRHHIQPLPPRVVSWPRSVRYPTPQHTASTSNLNTTSRAGHSSDSNCKPTVALAQFAASHYYSVYKGRVPVTSPLSDGIIIGH